MDGLFGHGAEWSVRLKLSEECAACEVWRQVQHLVNQDIATGPVAAWTVTVRAKTDTDDRMLVEDGEADDPTDYWAVYVDHTSSELTLCVPRRCEPAVLSPLHLAGFLLELLRHAADPHVGET
jgi:hypothetical protein